MRTPVLLLAIALIGLCSASSTYAQQAGLDRLAPDVFDVVPPSALVRGAPGRMTIIQAPACRTLSTEETRRRIVDVAVQEWGFFGFQVVDRTNSSTDDNDGVASGDAGQGGGFSPDPARGPQRRPRPSVQESARVAASIAGYWAVTPEGSWIVERQNDSWKGPRGVAARWNAPWSAAFISWVMCEAGLGGRSQFQRAVAHHTYIDQAIRARDGRGSEAAFVAYDTGEAEIAPGDLLCSSRRPTYRTIAERRRQMGVGARSHCDIVVKVDEAGERVLAIGGNVRGSVSLKVFPVVRAAGKPLRLVDTGGAERPMFAHLKLRANPIDANALDTSPTIGAFGCVVGTGTPRLRADNIAANVAAAAPVAGRC